MNFIFSVSTYNSGLFQSQISTVLEKRNELLSRKKFPKLWKFIDKMRAARMCEKVLKRRRHRYKIYGVILLLMGIYLFIPGLMDPKELFAPLVGGALNIILGIGYICFGRSINKEKPILKEKPTKKEKPTPFDKAAKKLYESYANLVPQKIVFDDAMIHLNEVAVIKYEEIVQVFVTTDFFAFIWKENITVLQRKDLTASSEREFLDFLASKSQKLYEIINVD